MSADSRPAWAIRLHAEREARGWTKWKMARELMRAAGVEHGSERNLARQILDWEKGVHFPRDWAAAYASAFGMGEEELFATHRPMADIAGPTAAALAYEPYPMVDGMRRRRFLLDFLAGLGLAVPAATLLGTDDTDRRRPIGREHLELVQNAMAQLERQDAQLGGGLVCEGAAALLGRVQHWLQHSSFPVDIEGALYQAAGQLGVWVGWTAYDADRHSMARQYYCETLLLARTREDLQLEADTLQCMSLQARRQERPREAVRLAKTALRVSAGWATPRMTALLKLRCAQGYAGMGDVDGFRRYLVHAKNDYNKGPHQDDPWDLGYLTSSEVTGIEGMAYATLGQHERAAGLFQAIREEPQSAFRRNNAYYTVRLADALHRAGDHADAFAVAAEAVPLVAEVHSARTRTFLAGLRGAPVQGKVEEAERFHTRYDQVFGSTQQP